MVTAVAVARGHPRHVVLFAFVAGLLLGPLSPAGAVIAAPLAGLVLGPRPAAVVAALAVLAGSIAAQARLAALGPGKLPALAGHAIEARGILLEPLRQQRDGSAVTRVRLAGRATVDTERRESWNGEYDVDDLADPPSGTAAVAVDDGAPGDATDGERATAALDGEIAVARAADGRIPRGAQVGAELTLRGVVAPLGDGDAYQRRRGAHATIVVASWRTTGHRRGGLAGRLDAARERAAGGLGRALGAPEAALLRGMVIGQDDAIAEDVREDFRRSGLAHLLAVSGQNVLLLCMLVLAACAVLDVPLRARLIAAGVLVALYVPLAGGGPSIQRAGVMGIAGLVAALAGRPGSRWYALGLAAAVTLVLNPLAAGDPGWQLSFAAVVGLLAIAPALRDALVRRRTPAPLADVTAITVAATLATAPLMALHFEQVSIASLPANLLAAPVVAPVMWLGMIAMTVAQLSPALAVPFTIVCAPLLGYLEWIAHGAASAPLAALPVRLGGPLGLLAAYALLGAAGFALRRAARRGAFDAFAVGGLAGPWRAAALVAAIAVACAALAAVRTRGEAPPARGELVVSFLDVGQGDATLLQLDGASVLVDTGPPRGPILRRLKEAGVERLDLLVLTHAEADHEGMALAVIAAHRPRLVLDGGAGWPTAVQRGLPAALQRARGRVVPASAGQRLAIGRLRVRVLWPPAPAPGWRPDGNPNDRAVVAHVSVGDFDLLLPADAESNVTAALDLPEVEALKVAHHGSADPGLEATLERTSPDVAAIEVGGDNTYGHPAPSTLAALRGVPRLVRTDRDGTVRLRVAGGRMRLDPAGAGA